MSYFKVTYYASDGYITGDRPLEFEINEDDFDLEDFETKEEIMDFFWDTVREDFEQNVGCTSDDDDKFIKWIKELKEKQRGETNE